MPRCSSTRLLASQTRQAAAALLNNVNNGKFSLDLVSTRNRKITQNFTIFEK